MRNCFICNLPYEKGIGICCSRQCHNKRINTRSRENDRHVRAAQQRIRDYESNPKLCANCNKPLTYEQFHQRQKFCSHSCSAIDNNSKRDKLSYQKQAATLRLRFSTSEIRKVRWPFSPVNFRNCKTCNKVFRSIQSRKYCSDICKITTDIKVYRRACKFKIIKQLYPELFDNDLLQRHGWYRAANHPIGYNPDGATWDHLFRIEDGFKLKVSPEIMHHPANAQMISWKENFARKTSSISYDELLLRIKSL